MIRGLLPLTLTAICFGLAGTGQAAVDPILEWNAVMLEANAVDCAQTNQQQPGPILVGRAFAMVSAAMYDAMNSIDSIGTPYRAKAPNGQGASVDAAVAQAAHDVLVSLYSQQIVIFDTALADTLARIPDGASKDQGISVGKYIAADMIQGRANDGAANLDTPPYVPINALGFHNVDPLNPNEGFYGSQGGSVTSFAIRNVDQFVAPALDDASIAGRAAFLQSDKYTAAYNEVLALGGDGVNSATTRTEEQTQIGIFWGYDGRPGLGKPPRLYNQILRVIAEQENNAVEQNARLFALANVAMGDAGIVAWWRKYTDQFWRPVLGIRNAGSTGNPNTPGERELDPLRVPAQQSLPGRNPVYTTVARLSLGACHLRRRGVQNPRTFLRQG